jgi:phosphoribosylformimino-5-aminoimidazole carboxamide ribonucleotide (ProFAR) isomerase
VRTRAAVDALLELGAARIVVSSSVLADEDSMQELMGWIRPDELVFGLEVDNGRVHSRGAVEVDLDLDETLARVRDAGVGGLLVTAVGRVGARSGPDTALVRRVAAVADVPIVAAGGIRSIEDLAALREAGADGAVVGRAAVEGSLDLGAALGWAEAEGS